ncbi:uncharacterized protein EDB93DRAFT_1252909 [Suillus bovinus]|uniref:uncharacterized protein n=1 Tax=Suillus bovinus TaxID=48563 RepID=UPI001B884C32|nr:uncharacterized protein EDB93DRAFT_1252909 [Suillus bovinus]KAG2140270.1 hypothetical protein EDB93DRAFT_1252909 [Suillus bovinus]
MSSNNNGARYTAAMQKVHIKWSSEQKAALRAKHAQHHIDYGTTLKEAREVVQYQAEMLHEKFGKHSVNYYYQEIMQKSCLEHNKEREKQGLSKEKVHVIAAEVSAQWKCINKEERSDATDDLMQSLTDQCEMKDLALHNVPLNAFQDGRKTLDSIDRKLSALNARTGMEILLFAVRSDVEHFNQPHIFQTSHTSAFFDACLGTSVGNIALCLEGFSIAGVQGMAKTHVQEVLEWKKKTGELIHKKLQETAAPIKISRMYYINFDNNITMKHHIILKNWPLSKFCCPGDISSLNEPKVLFYAFDTGAASFQKLTDAKYDQWSNEHFQAALAEQNGCTTEDMPNVDEQDEDEGAGGIGNNHTALSETDINAIVEAAPKRRTKWRAAELINTVTTSSGAALPVQKKLHAPRKDKGIPHGPRKKKMAQLTAAPSHDASIVSPTATHTPSNPSTMAMTPSAEPAI